MTDFIYKNLCKIDLSTVTFRFIPSNMMTPLITLAVFFPNTLISYYFTKYNYMLVKVVLWVTFSSKRLSHVERFASEG